VKIPLINKINTTNNSDFNDFIEKPNKSQKKNLMESSNQNPIVIINPIFDAEMNNRKASINSGNINADNLSNNSRKNVNISDKLSVGFIEFK